MAGISKLANPLLHPFWIGSVLVYLVLFGLKKAEISIPYVSWYAADLLAMPVVLGIVLWAWRNRPARREPVLPRAYVAATLLIFSLLFEWLFPLLTPRFTADPWDIACYTAGALAFCRIQNRG